MGMHTYIMYDVNDGLVDVVLEVTPTAEQQAERIKERRERKNERKMTKEKEYEIQEKYRPRYTGDACATCTSHALTKKPPQGRHAQGLDNGLAATAMHVNPCGTTRTYFTITKRSTLIQDLAGQVQKHRNMAGPNGIYVGFHVLGGR
jgi:hypothetical protein